MIYKSERNRRMLNFGSSIHITSWTRTWHHRRPYTLCYNNSSALFWNDDLRDSYGSHVTPRYFCFLVISSTYLIRTTALFNLPEHSSVYVGQLVGEIMRIWNAFVFFLFSPYSIGRETVYIGCNKYMLSYIDRHGLWKFISRLTSETKVSIHTKGLLLRIYGFSTKKRISDRRIFDSPNRLYVICAVAYKLVNF